MYQQIFNDILEEKYIAYICISNKSILFLQLSQSFGRCRKTEVKKEVHRNGFYNSNETLTPEDTFLSR